MKIEFLRQIDAALSKCGSPIRSGGGTALPLPFGFVVPMVCFPATSTVFSTEITGYDPWLLRAIASDQTSNTLTGVRVQIQLPNGRFLFGGNGIDVGQFSWVGSWKWIQDPDVRCEPGQVIQTTLTDSLGTLVNPFPVNFLFDGARLLYYKGGPTPPARPLASSTKRYYGIVNENILAPAWMSGEGHYTPPGFRDEYFQYASVNPADIPQPATWTLTGGAITQSPSPVPLEIVIDPRYIAHYVRRVLVDLQFTGSAAAVVMMRLRTGGGYVVNDNFIDYARYLNGAEGAGTWRVAGGDSVFADLQLADFSGTGTVTYQYYLEGYRRSRI